MAIYAVYDKQTGEIVRLLQAFNQKAIDANLKAGWGYLSYINYNIEALGSYKVNLTTLAIEAKTTQSITATPSIIDADGTTKSTLTGIAADSSAYLNADGIVKFLQYVKHGKMYFCTDIVATHDIIFKHPLYLDTTVEITATTP